MGPGTWGWSVSQAVPVAAQCSQVWASLGQVTPRAALSVVNIVLKVGGDMSVSILSIGGPRPALPASGQETQPPAWLREPPFLRAAPEPGAGVLEQG